METSASLLDLWTLQRPENISEMDVYGSGYYSAIVESKVMFALMTSLFPKLKWMKKRKVIPCDLGDLVGRILVSGSHNSTFHLGSGLPSIPSQLPEELLIYKGY